jgi:hypothetical protein
MRQFAGCEDAGSDREHAFSSFVHADECSVFAFYSSYKNASFYQQVRDIQPDSQIREPLGTKNGGERRGGLAGEMARRKLAPTLTVL